jgi:hypothetical protein
MIRTMPLRKSLSDMRKGGLEPPHLGLEVADPKSATPASAAPPVGNLAKRDSTTLHHVTPGITEHVILGRTRGSA